MKNMYIVFLIYFSVDSASPTRRYTRNNSRSRVRSLFGRWRRSAWYSFVRWLHNFWDFLIRRSRCDASVEYGNSWSNFLSSSTIPVMMPAENVITEEQNCGDNDFFTSGTQWLAADTGDTQLLRDHTYCRVPPPPGIHRLSLYRFLLLLDHLHWIQRSHRPTHHLYCLTLTRTLLSLHFRLLRLHQRKFFPAEPWRTERHHRKWQRKFWRRSWGKKRV